MKVGQWDSGQQMWCHAWRLQPHGAALGACDTASVSEMTVTPCVPRSRRRPTGSVSSDARLPSALTIVRVGRDNAMVAGRCGRVLHVRCVVVSSDVRVHACVPSIVADVWTTGLG